MDPMTELKDAVAEIEGARDAMRRRDAAIEAGLRAGIRGEHLAEAAGVSLRRVRQIANQSGIVLQRGRPRTRQKTVD